MRGKNVRFDIESPGGQEIDVRNMNVKKNVIYKRNKCVPCKNLQ
jgi:hypothetical protein